MSGDGSSRPTESTGKANDEDGYVLWHPLLLKLLAAENPVLILLNCCHAAAAAGTLENFPKDQPKWGKTELLAACGFEFTTKVRNAFTDALCSTLVTEFQESGSFTVAQLSTKIVQTLLGVQSLGIALLSTEEYKHLTKTPIHISLNKASEAGIVLQAFGPQPSSIEEKLGASHARQCQIYAEYE